MSEANHERILVEVVREIAQDMGLEFKSFSHDWILQLKKGGEIQYIVGYNFEINSATARMLAADKAATSSLLADANIAHVDHQLFLHPRLASYVSSKGNWDAMQAYGKKYDYQLVVKPNDGTGGQNVRKVENPLELEQSVTRLFEEERAIAISPFINIEQEFRAILLDDKVMLIYAKMRPTLIGNGQSTLIELLQRLSMEQNIPQTLASQAIEKYEGDLSKVLAEGEKVALAWKHNLGAGAIPQILADEDLSLEISKLAIAGRKAIGIRFASVDIVQAAGELKVLEINAGIMMEYFSRHFPEERERVKAIYAKALKEMFAQ